MLPKYWKIYDLPCEMLKAAPAMMLLCATSFMFLVEKY